MGRNATRHAVRSAPVDLAKVRAQRRAEPPAEDAIRRSLERLVSSVAARWRGHEPEIAILTATTLILAVAAMFAGADPLFTLMVTAAAAVTIWSPWRQPD